MKNITEDERSIIEEKWKITKENSRSIYFHFTARRNETKFRFVKKITLGDVYIWQ
ncbi:hypothetical protein [Bacillus sp. NPDC060175]|uniref:hypothetical protein n=1 Tax=Bacillus sp. NPDC060175 TaxID=3347061 RepID=UPI00364641C8